MAEIQKRLVELSYCDNVCASCGKSIAEQDTEYLLISDEGHKEAFCFVCAESIKGDM
jgi:hypothetical protein